MALFAQNRLSKKKDFDTVFKGGRIIKGSFLFIKIAENSRMASRFGIVVSSKVAGKATVRNKIKRDLSDFIRLNIGRIRGEHDVIIVIRNGSVSIDELRKDLENILKKANIII